MAQKQTTRDALKSGKKSKRLKRAKQNATDITSYHITFCDLLS